MSHDDRWSFYVVITAAWIVGWFIIALGASDLYGPGVGPIVWGCSFVAYSAILSAILFARSGGTAP